MQGQKSEFTDDFMFQNIIDPVMCAKLCVGFDNFTCNSFDFCPGDAKGSCRLSRRHISEGSSHLVKGGGCDHFSSMNDSCVLLTQTAVVWLKYCRYGVKHYQINQSIILLTQMIRINKVNDIRSSISM